MKTFIITIGIAGAGKSTAIKNHFPSATVISPDSFIGYNDKDPWSFSSVKNAWKKADAILVEALGRGDEEVIFDATFPKVKKRRKYIEKAKSFGYEVVALYCPIPLKIALARNESRDKFRAVPKMVIEDMNRNLAEPKMEEGFVKILTFNSVMNILVEE
jgi:predicted kinase